MSMRPPQPGSAERARARALLEAGATRGALALAGLLGWKGAAAKPWRGGRAGGTSSAFALGVCFEMEGDLSGSMSLLLDRETCVELVEALAPGLEGPAADSVLCEVANIVVSQAVSAMADAVGGRVTLSVPKPEGPAEVAERIGAGRFVGCRLVAQERSTGLVLGFEPTAPDSRF